MRYTDGSRHLFLSYRERMLLATLLADFLSEQSEPAPWQLELEEALLSGPVPEEYTPC